MHTSLFQPTLSFLVSLLLIPVLQLSGTTFVAADHLGSGSHRNLPRRHNVVRDAVPTNSILTKNYNATVQTLERRGPGAHMTFFVTGLGACGRFNQPSDFIVALNKEQFDQGGACFKQITINVGGRTAQAQIVDRCELCGWGNIDLTEGLFHFLGGTVNGGTLSGSWEYGSGAVSPPPKTSTPPPPPPTTTSRVQATSTPSSTIARVTSTSASSSASPSSSSVSSSASHTSTSASASASTSAPASSPSVPADQGNLSQMYLNYIGMAGMALAAAKQG